MGKKDSTRHGVKMAPPDYQRDAARIYKLLLRVRRFDEKAYDLFGQGILPGSIHTYIGMEAVAVGVGINLEPQDYTIATHRGHGHCLMRGSDMKLMMAELLGKKTGLCRGKGGSMHIIDVERGMLGANGIVAQGIPIATGVGLSIQYRKSNQVCVCFFGDGASNAGVFHEGLNVSAVWKLPVVFVCENNQYALSVAAKKVTSVEDIADRAHGYGIPGIVVDGMDVTAVSEVARQAIDRARQGQGPTLMECKTYRFLGHSRGDPPYGPYRSKEEVLEWKRRDPLIVFREKTRLEDSVIRAIEKEVEQELEEAVAFAMSSPDPDVSEALDDIYAA